MPGRILIADAVATNRIMLKVKLSSAHHDVTVAESGAEILDIVRRDPPDLMILDEGLPDMSGVELCLALKSDPVARRVPVIMLTDRGDAEARVAALDAGADEFLSKPLDEVTLMARVRSLMRARETHDALDRRRITVEELGFAEPATLFEAPARIAFVPRRADSGLRWKHALRGLVRDPIEIFDEDGALAAMNSGPQVDLFLIEADLLRPRDGLRLLCELRSGPATRHAAIVILHHDGDSDTAAMALDLGANDIVASCFLPAELAIRIRTQIRRKKDADRLRASVEDGLRLAVTDPLTGLYNRRYALSHLARVAERAARGKRPFAVMVADIDRFKSVNDGWGHAAGDAVLVETARRLRDNLRDVDLVARVGGEEFLVAMPDTDAEAAGMAAERLRRVVSAAPVQVPGGPSLSVTISIGVAVRWSDDAVTETVPELIERADQALFDAKSDGRNQVTLSRPAA